MSGDIELKESQPNKVLPTFFNSSILTTLAKEWARATLMHGLWQDALVVANNVNISPPSVPQSVTSWHSEVRSSKIYSLSNHM